MNTKHKILPAICSIAMMTACASNQSTSAAPWTVRPTAVTKNSSEKPEAMYRIGRYYQGQNRFDEAINAYMKVLQAAPDFVEARNGLGVIYSRQGKYREAIEAFQTAIQQSPKAAHLYSNMGYAYYLQGNYAESVKALQQATALDPNNQRAFNNLGMAYAKAGNITESVEAFAEASTVSTQQANNAVAVAPEQPAPGTTAVVTNIAAAPDVDANVKAASANDAQVLAIPKNRGVIRSAEAATPAIPVVESRVKLVQLAPNVSELQLKAQDAEPLQVASAGNQQELQKLRLEVANGNGVTGAAGKVGRFLREQGYTTARLTNQRPFRTQTTQIQYRSGYEAQALLVQSKLLDAPKLVQRDDMRANVSVRVVLGKDMVTQLAHYESKVKGVQLALNGAGDEGKTKQFF